MSMKHLFKFAFSKQVYKLVFIFWHILHNFNYDSLSLLCHFIISCSKYVAFLILNRKKYY
jgi:hypothetical protein